MSFIALQSQHALNTAVAIAAAYLLALPLGWERKAKSTSNVGLRTLPLVSVGTCAYLLISRYLYERGIFDADGEARVLRAMMTGIGFIGGGAILKEAGGRGVEGVTTAASVWTSGALGAAIAHGYYAVAAVLVLTSLFVIEVTARLPARRKTTDDDRNAPSGSAS